MDDVRLVDWLILAAFAINLALLIYISGHPK